MLRAATDRSTIAHRLHRVHETVLAADLPEATRLAHTVDACGPRSSASSKPASPTRGPKAWLRALAPAEHNRCAGPGVGVVGMCFSAGFALAMAVDPRVLAPVMAQPGLPLPVTPGRRHAIDCSPADLDCVAHRCRRDGLRVLGLQFRGDPFVPEEQFALLREKLGDGFIAVELDPADRNPAGPLPRPHSVLTGDLVDQPGTPTRAALDRALDLIRTTLLGETQ